jgi:hypothetical protein
MVLHVEWTMLGKNLSSRSLTGLVKLGQGWLGLLRRLLRKDFKQCETVVDGAMTLMKIPCLPDQISKLGAFKPTTLPIDFRIRAGLGLPGKTGSEGLTEWSTKSSNVTDDEIRRISESRTAAMSII